MARARGQKWRVNRSCVDGERARSIRLQPCHSRHDGQERRDGKSIRTVTIDLTGFVRDLRLGHLPRARGGVVLHELMAE
jgi:hypothetical protein